MDTKIDRNKMPLFLPNNQRILVLPLFAFENAETGEFKKIRVRMDEILGYFDHCHEISIGQDHTFLVKGTHIEFKTFESRCSVLQSWELDFVLTNENSTSERLVNHYSRDRMGFSSRSFANQDFIYQKVEEVKREIEAKNSRMPAPDLLQSKFDSDCVEEGNPADNDG